MQGDVTSADDLERLVGTTVDAFGGMDILVNNSGGPPRATAREVDADNVLDAVRLLLVSAVRLTSLCLPHLEQSAAGRIVNVTSSTVREPIDNLALSNTVRPGLVGWAKTLARQLGPLGITVNCIAPGRIDTERIREVYPDGPTEADLASDPAPPARDPARDRRPRRVPLLGPGGLRHGCADRGRRRPYARSPLVRLRYLVAILGAVALATFALWTLPASDFIFTPDRAKPLEGRVRVEGAKPAKDGVVYYVDVFVRRATRLEQLLPFTRPDGATIVPERALLPEGTSDEERDRENAEHMRKSEVIASAVALSALGYDVRATPRGAEVSNVAPDGPAAAEAPHRRRHRRRRTAGREDARRAARGDRASQARRGRPPDGAP